MALDPTAREANLRDSVKKFFVDNINVTEGVPLTFDRGLAVPAVQGVEADRWVAIIFGDLEMGTVSVGILDVYCCTKMDNEGFRLAQLRDKVVGYLTDVDSTDGFKRIDFYRSHPTNPWTLLGALVVTKLIESRQFVTEDETKFKILSLDLKWASKI